MATYASRQTATQAPSTGNTTSLTITGEKTYSFGTTESYSETFNLTQTVDDVDTFVVLTKFDASDITAQSLRGANSIVINNTGKAMAEIRLSPYTWIAGTPDSDGATPSYQSLLLAPGNFIHLPSSYFVDYSASSSACNGASVTNTTPLAAGKWAAGSTDGTTKQAQLDGAVSDADATTITVEDNDSDSNGKIEDLFMAGDYIRLTNEVMLVTGVTTDDSGVLTVERGQLGSTATTHADQLAVALYHYNCLFDFDKFSDVRTGESGNGYFSNFFGYGRVYTGGGTDKVNRGLVPGSVAIKFYSQGAYQELGLSNVTTSTNTGLAVSTEYGFDITVDGSGLLDSDVLKFTTDSSNVNWGGTNGVLSKIQAIFDAQYYTTSSAIIGERVTVGIVDGDIRFSSGSNLSTSAILLAAPSAGETTPFGVGAIPAIGSVQSPVAARLPDNTFIDKHGIVQDNTNEFLLDRGDGTMTRGNGGSATINYETGACHMRGCPPMSSFVVNVNYGSALAGGYHNDAQYGHTQIKSISARSVNQMQNAQVELVVFY